MHWPTRKYWSRLPRIQHIDLRAGHCENSCEVFHRNKNTTNSFTLKPQAT